METVVWSEANEHLIISRISVGSRVYRHILLDVDYDILVMLKLTFCEDVVIYMRWEETFVFKDIVDSSADSQLLAIHLLHYASFRAKGMCHSFDNYCEMINDGSLALMAMAGLFN